MPPRVAPLDASRMRHVVLGHLLHSFSLRPPVTETVLLNVQQQLSRVMRIPVAPTTSAENEATLRRLGLFAVGRGGLPPGVVDVLRHAFNDSDIALPADVGSPSGMRELLCRVGYFTPRGNPHRVIASHRIDLPAAVHSHVPKHLVSKDPFDSLRQHTTENVYAIDSATTSEVDDAIGLSIDANGVEWITVYVSDATVHCPFDSELEQLSARTLATTTYLPEGVFFMLPHPIVEAATLRSDRPCRSFDVRFRIDSLTGEVRDISIHVGWCHALRRITYDATQDILKSGSRVALPSSPSWLNADDIAKLHRLMELARLRLETRRKAGRAFEGSMPDPLIKVNNNSEVLDVCDQVLNTVDARLLVAEMMIAANEACAREAQLNNVPIAFRGSRPLSTAHEAALDFSPPRGSTVVGPSDANLEFASLLVSQRRRLFSVTRAMYSATPQYHNGLDTINYCHATSPLRRYPDMLVHHQLKSIVARKHGLRLQELISEAQMAELCGNASRTQEQGSLLQMQSDRFWILSFLRDSLSRDPSFLLTCFVGETRLSASTADGPRSAAKFVSDVYVERVQMLHFIEHHAPLPSAVISCRIAHVDPFMDSLRLEFVVGKSDLADSVERLTSAASAFTPET